jgi:hypothetical protein
MKRAIFIIIAALLVLLVYPSTHSFAKSAIGRAGGPIVFCPISDTGQPICLSDEGDDESDGGDGDDVAGFKQTGKNPIGGSSVMSPLPGARNFIRVWWNFMIWIR